jgi:membrane-associated phospholipid phosphatase
MLKRNILWRLILFLCLASHAYAQQPDTASKNIGNSYLASYWTNGVGLVSSPFRWKTSDWLHAGGAVAITGLVITMDEAINVPFSAWNRNGGGEAFGEVGNVLGGPAVQFSLSGAAIGIGAISKNKKLTHFGLDNLQAQAYSAGFAVVFKELFHRARPNTGEGSFAFYGPFHGKENKSFYSGHTTLAFTTATMAYLHSGKKWWVGAISYSLATYVGLSRMQMQEHWASDVLAGGIMGTVIANYVYKQQEKRRMVRQTIKPLP